MTPCWGINQVSDLISQVILGIETTDATCSFILSLKQGLLQTYRSLQDLKFLSIFDSNIPSQEYPESMHWVIHLHQQKGLVSWIFSLLPLYWESWKVNQETNEAGQILLQVKKSLDTLNNFKWALTMREN